MNKLKRITIWIMIILTSIISFYYIKNILEHNEVRVNDEFFNTKEYLFHLLAPSIIIPFVIITYSAKKIDYSLTFNFIFIVNIVAIIFMIISPFYIFSCAENTSNYLCFLPLMKLSFIFAIPSTFLSYLFLNIFLILGKKFFHFHNNSEKQISALKKLTFIILFAFLIAYPFLQFIIFNNQSLMKFILS